jgi:hypothetical protein
MAKHTVYRYYKGQTVFSAGLSYQCYPCVCKSKFGRYVGDQVSVYGNDGISVLLDAKDIFPGLKQLHAAHPELDRARRVEYVLSGKCPSCGDQLQYVVDIRRVRCTAFGVMRGECGFDVPSPRHITSRCVVVE